MLPALHERRKVRKLDRLDLLSEGGKRTSPSNLDYAPRAPFEILNLAPEFSSDQLASPFPFGESGLDPFARRAESIMDLPARYWAGLCKKPRENLAPRNWRRDRRVTKYLGYESLRILFLEPDPTAYPGYLLGPECREVTRIRLRQNKAPHLHLVGSKSDRDDA